MKSIDLWGQGMSKGRYAKVTIDSTLQVHVSAIHIADFRREEYEDNGAQHLSFLVSALDAEDMKTPVGEPVREQILLGQRPSPMEVCRYFPLRTIEFYLKLCEFESKGGEAFFIWNEEHHRAENTGAGTTNEYRPRPATLMSQHT